MKFNIAALDLNMLIREMQYLVGAKVDKIFHPEKRELILRLHVPGKGRRIIRALVPSFVYVSEYAHRAKEPSSFCMFLRKRLANARLRAVNQLGFERILELVFEKKKDDKIVSFRLIFEFFLKGNIILCDGDYNIISPLEMQKWTGRTVKAKVAYEYPKKDYNFLDIGLDRIKPMLSGTKEKEIVLVLAKDLGLGGAYSEEICLRSGIAKNLAPEKLDDKDVKQLFMQLKSLREHEISPEAVKDEKGEIKAITPFSMKIYEGLEREIYPFFNTALDEILTKEKKKQQDESFLSKHQKEIGKVEKIVESQQKKLTDVTAQIEECNEIADSIYKNYQMISSIIGSINKARENYSWKEIKEKLKGHKIIKEVLPKEKCIVVEL